MSIFKRGGTGNYYIQFDFNGKTYVKSSRTTNRKVAERMEREWKAEIHAQEELGELKRITVLDALLAHTQQRNRDKPKDYVSSLVRVVREKFPVNLYVDELKDWHLARFKTEREQEGVSAQTIKHNFQAVRNAWKWAKEHGYQVKPLTYPSLKLEKHRLRYLSLDEERRLLTALDPKARLKGRPSHEDQSPQERKHRQDNYDLVVLLLDTGARYSEIANITWDRINLDQKWINLWRPKVRNESIIYMTGRVHEILKRRFEAKTGDYLFTNDQGGPRGYSAKGIYRAFKRAGLGNFRIHDLRHTCASRLAQNGMNLYEVAQVLGHTDTQTTQRYAHLEARDISEKARDIMERLSA